MNLRNFLSRIFTILLLLVCAAAAQDAGDAPSPVQPGIVVEAVAHNSAAEKAGIQKGDVLLQWKRGATQGALESPFELFRTETEQSPFGTVLLEGLHGAEKQVWSLGPGDWGLKVRPNFTGNFLPLYLKGQELADAGKATEAAEQWRTLAAQLSGSSSPPWLFFHSAEGLATAQQWKEADDAYQSAFQQVEKTDPRVAAQLLQSWARSYLRRNDWTNAEKYFQQSITFSRQIVSGDLAVASSLNGLGLSSAQRGEINKAEEYYRQALDIREHLVPGTLVVAASFNSLGIVASQRGDLPKAEEYFRQALDIKKNLVPGSLDLAGSLNNIGIVASQRGDLARAEEYYRQSLQVKEKLVPGSLAVAGSLANLGSVAHERGELAKAEEYYRQALDIQQKLAPQSLDISAILSNLGNVAWKRVELEKAEEYYRQAFDIVAKLAPGSLDVAAIVNNIANVANDRGELEKAEKYYRQALAIQQKLAPDSLDVALTFNNIGTVARDRGELKKAEEYYRQALDIKQRLAPESLDLAQTLRNLGTCAYKSGDLGKAEQYHKQALAIEEKLAPGSLVHAESLAAIASIFREQRQVETAAQLYAQAITAMEEQTARLGGSGEIRSNFRANHSAIYRDYIDLLLTQKRPELAFEVVERSRAQGLIAMLNAARIDVHNGVDAALLERKRSLSADLQAKSNRRIQLLTTQHLEKQVAGIEKEIADLRDQLQETEEQIRSKNPSYHALTHPLSLSTKDMRQLLDPETVLLEYFLGEHRSHVFVLTTESLNAYELPRSVEIEKAARRVHDLLTARVRKIKGETEQERTRRRRQEDAEYPQAVLNLSRKVWAPVPMPAGKKHLLIVADGALQYIPFAVLPTPLVWHSNKQQPLLANYDIVALPSVQTLAVLRQQLNGRLLGPKAVAVLADPVFDLRDIRIKTPRRGPQGDPAPKLKDKSEQQEQASSPDSWPADRLTRSLGDLGRSLNGQLYLPRLSFTREEARAIVATVPSGQALEALDFKASRQTATSPELAQYRIVHFATHGVLDSVHPEFSGLVLSMVNEAGERQNGFLGLEDIYNLNLPADLVVLSACETGLGKEVHGEGLIGLTRGFMYAGAARVLASLWEVDDIAASELMGRFYQAMEKKGMRPAAALRAAQLQMWKQKRWNSPFYWAAFQMQGEWR